MSVVKRRATKFFAKLVRCKLKGFAKIPVQRIAEVVRARFYHGAKFRPLLIVLLVVILLGSAFPKPCLSDTAANFPLSQFGKMQTSVVYRVQRKI